jgi:hypothetical protein
MSDDEREEYEGDLLTQGNALNAAIKQYLGTNRHTAEALEGYKTDILGYLVDIGDEEFGPRPDRLTKEGIEDDLNVHLTMINGLLRQRNTGVGKRKRKRSRRSRQSRRRSHKRKRSRQSRRQSKRRSNKRSHKRKRSRRSRQSRRSH